MLGVGLHGLPVNLDSEGNLNWRLTERERKRRHEHHKKQRAKDTARAKRREKRKEARRSKLPPFPKGLGPPHAIATDMRPLVDFPVTSTGYTGNSQSRSTSDKHIWTLKELIQEGLDVFEWDGRQVKIESALQVPYKMNLLLHRTPYTILDHEDRIIAVLAGRPYSKDGETGGWDGVATRACAAIEAARRDINFDEEDLNHRRGPHIGKAYGWSHGQGQQVWVWE
jgi:hypothetical protein